MDYRWNPCQPSASVWTLLGWRRCSSRGTTSALVLVRHTYTTLHTHHMHLFYRVLRASALPQPQRGAAPGARIALPERRCRRQCAKVQGRVRCQGPVCSNLTVAVCVQHHSAGPVRSQCAGAGPDRHDGVALCGSTRCHGRGTCVWCVPDHTQAQETRELLLRRGGTQAQAQRRCVVCQHVGITHRITSLSQCAARQLRVPQVQPEGPLYQRLPGDQAQPAPARRRSDPSHKIHMQSTPCTHMRVERHLT